jgi:hypothetical protein
MNEAVVEKTWSREFFQSMTPKFSFEETPAEPNSSIERP